MSAPFIEAGAFRALLEAATDAIIVSNASNQILYSNPAAHHVFGYAGSEINELSLPQLMPERFREAHNQGQRRFIESGTAKVIGNTVELAGLHRSGEEFPLELSLGAWTSASGDHYFVGILRDISSRKAAEATLSGQVTLIHLFESLAAAANQSEGLAEAANVCLTKICSQLNWPIAHIYIVEHRDKGAQLVPIDIWCGSQSSHLTTFREATRQHTFNPGEGLAGTVYRTGKPAWVVDVETDAVFVRKEAAAASGIKTAFAVPVLIRTEVVAVLEFFSHVSAPPDETIIEVTSYTAAQLGRVVEREQSARKLRELNAELENRVFERTRELEEARDIALAASRTKSAFLANMSHELRTPLNAIVGYAELVHEEVSAAGLQSTAADVYRIINASTHLTKLISDVLDLSKIEAGKMDIDLEALPVSEVVLAACEATSNEIARNENRLHINCDSTDYVWADRLRLQQVLLNLLSNAGKFTRAGDITVSCKRGSGYVEIVVADTGIGISKDDIGRLFQKFEQLDSSTTRRHGGTGLGLVISRTLCQLMEGDLTVQSELNVGSTFTIRLLAR